MRRFRAPFAIAAAALLFSAGAGVVAAAEDAAGGASHGIAPLTGGEVARYNYVPPPAPVAHSKAEVTFTGAWLFDMGGDVRKHRGWGGALGVFITPDVSPEHPDWRLKFGAEAFIFHADRTWRDAGAGGRRHSSVAAGALTFDLGASWRPVNWFEAGATAGLGLAGSYVDDSGERDDPNGNINWAFVFRPEVAFHISKHTTLVGGYRLGFVTPVVRTENWRKLDYRTVDILHQSVDISLRFRF